MREAFAEVMAGCTAFIREMEPTDECALMYFVSSDRIAMVQDFTSNKQLLLKALGGLYIEGGQSAIVDAMYFANQHLWESTKGTTPLRRAVVAFTDGENRQSSYKEGELFKLIEKDRAPILLIAPKVGYQTLESGEQAEKFLNRLAVTTGGVVHRVSSVSDYDQALTAIALEMRAPYVLTYNSTNRKLDGKLRKIRVEVVSQPPHQKFGVFFRTGYTAPEK
jgi:VWFA-related protein